MMIALLAIVLTLVLVIGLHEAGHALAAKLAGVKIVRISIGFGKPLFLWQKKEGIEWVWARWPLGGYVQLLNSRIRPVDKTEYWQCFDKQPIWIRCLILISGALANLLVAFFALILFFMLGYQQQIPVVQAVTPNSIAKAAGINAFDRFIAIDGYQTASWQEVGMRLILNLGQNVVVKVMSSKNVVHELNLNLKSPLSTESGSLLAAIGIAPGQSSEYQQTIAGLSLGKAGQEAIARILLLLGFFLVLLKQLFSGAIPFTFLLGPIGLLTISVGSFAEGLAMFLYFIASLSLAVGLVNLFPFPGLDGGSLILAIAEKIRAKPVSIGFEILLYRLAMIVFCIVMLQLVMNDMQRYLKSTAKKTLGTRQTEP